jgi:hypothetical protein
LSFCEIEYMILSKTAKKAIWIRECLRELEFRSRDDQLVLIFADNKNAIDLIINSLYHKRTKHIKMRWHWIRKMMNRKKTILRYLFISEMIADNRIKSLSVSAFSKFRIMLNLSHWLIIKRWSSYWCKIIIMIKWKCWIERCKMIYHRSLISRLL